MAEAANPERSLSDIAASYRDLATGSDVPSLRALGDLVDHIAAEYGDSRLFCWTSVSTLCISQHRWTSPSDWLPYLRIEPVSDQALEFRCCDSGESMLDWVRIVPPEGVIGRFDAFVEQLHWRAQPIRSKDCA